MKRTPVAVVMVVLLSLAVVAADDLTSLVATAHRAWSNRDYQQFTDTCKTIEALNPSFTSAFNVALGYYLLGHQDDALTKLKQIRNTYSLDEHQTSKLKVLSDEIESNKHKIVSIRKEIHTTVIMSDPGVQRDTPNEKCARSANCLGLSPNEVVKYMKENQRRAMIGLGYDLPVESPTSTPEW